MKTRDIESLQALVIALIIHIVMILFLLWVSHQLEDDDSDSSDCGG